MPIGNGSAIQHDAQEDVPNLPAVLVSTDPPYYNNVPYADFSDFFYCWLRKNIGDAMLVLKDILAHVYMDTR